MIRRSLLAALAVLAAVTGALGPSAGADAARTYGAPYALGPSTPGDQFNVSRVDAQAGSITLARAYPVPATVSCGGHAPGAMFEVREPVTGPITSVTVNYANAAFDDFTFLDVTLTDLDAAGNRVAALGAYSTRGPMVALAGSVTLTFDGTTTGSHFWQQPAVSATAPHQFAVRFGLHLSSACLPAKSADAGTITFPSVTIS